MRILLVLTALVLIAQSCSKEHKCGCVPPPFDGYYNLKAVVRSTSNVDCGKPELVFEDTAAIHGITQTNMDIAIVDNFPVHLNIAGQKVWVKVKPLKAEEQFPCTTLGIAYPHVKFISAAVRD